MNYLLFCRAGAQLVISCCRWSLVNKTLQFRAITLHCVKVAVRSAATCCSVRPYPRLNQSQAFARHEEQSLHSRFIVTQTFLLLVRQLLMAGLIFKSRFCITASTKRDGIFWGEDSPLAYHVRRRLHNGPVTSSSHSKVFIHFSTIRCYTFRPYYSPSFLCHKNIW
jgi:hypothetical protein